MDSVEQRKIPEAEGFSSRFLRITGKNFSALVRYEFLAELDERRLLDLISEEVGFRSDLDSPGRAAVRRITFESGRKVIFRRFFRGGFVRKINRELFLRLTSKIEFSRPEWELRILDLLFERGRNVPKPVASMVSLSYQGFAYRGAIASEEIARAENLLTIVRERSKPETRILDYCRRAGEEAGLILGEGILHRDLHLGNVLIDGGRKIVLLDFDSAKIVSTDAERKRARVFLERRWQRSLRRHGLSGGYLTEFLAGLDAVLAQQRESRKAAATSGSKSDSTTGDTNDVLEGAE